MQKRYIPFFGMIVFGIICKEISYIHSLPDWLSTTLSDAYEALAIIGWIGILLITLSIVIAKTAHRISTQYVPTNQENSDEQQTKTSDDQGI